jgi:A/G-specific adenine glycosylase
VNRPTSNRRFRSLAANLEAWFRESKRDLPWRRAYDPYQVWVAEVMGQQTRMEVVVPYFERFVSRFPDAGALAAATEEEVLALWSGLGYYRRARMLHAGARVVASRGGSLPADPEELEGIPGIGRYTAGAIASIAFEVAAPVVDGNVARVASRIEKLEDRIGSASLAAAEWEWAGRLVRAAASPRALNQALMELGARICRPRNPLCAACPVARACKARAAGDPAAYPRRAPRPAAVPITVRLFLVEDGGGRFLLQKSESGRGFGGMFHLPHGCGSILGRDDSARFEAVELLGSFAHAITQKRISFEIWRAAVRDRVAESPCEEIWAGFTDLDRLPHPSYVRKAIAIAHENAAAEPALAAKTALIPPKRRRRSAKMPR